MPQWPSVNVYVHIGQSVSSVTHSYPTLCDPIDFSTLGFSVHHQLLEFAQIHVYRVGDAIQPSHPLSSTVNFSSCLQSSQASGSFLMNQFSASGGQSIRASTSASVPPMNVQDWFPSGLTAWSPCKPRDSQESSPTLQFKSINSSVLSFLYWLTLTSIHDY